jgi:hypothetical protein
VVGKQLFALLTRVRLSLGLLNHTGSDTQSAMSFKSYRRNGTTEMRPFIEGEDTSNIAISDDARSTGSPKTGDWIARDKDNHADQWLVTEDFFNRNQLVEVAEEPATA